MTTAADSQPASTPYAFDDGKAPDALRTIGEVARALGIKPHVLRYWEEQFPALTPVKRSGGRRYYRPDDIEMIAEIDRLIHREGYTLRGARMAIEDKAAGQDDAESVMAGTGTPDAGLVEALVDIRTELAGELARA